MRAAFALLFVVTACGGGSTGKVATPHVDTGRWIDPADDLPAAPADAELVDPTVNPAARPIAIVGATVLTAAGQRFDDGTVVASGGRLLYIGDGSAAIPEDAVRIDGRGKFVTPGIIDAHSHLGVYASPATDATADGNEMTAAVTAQARAEYGFWPQDPGITRARAGGVTAALILPGSANLIGGRGFTVAMRTGRTTDDVRFPSAPPTLKMACGENPKRVYGDKGGPKTRMAEYAAFRAAFQAAADYRAKWTAYRRKHQAWVDKQKRAKTAGKAAAKPEVGPEPPGRDQGLDTLAAVLDGKVLVEVHCYRADDLRQMIAVADEFGFSIRAFHHALEAYKVRDLLIAHGVAIATWADWWGYKMEMFDGIPENAALFTESGGRAVIHSDSEIGIQRLNQEAAKAMYAGRAAGIAVSDDQALRWITANPAWVLGIDRWVGTLEVGKRADLVVWSGNPFSVYSKADLVIQAGEVTYDRSQGLVPTDFELDNSALAAPAEAK
jgi:imidazolonepropionase-like amidohydrolase